MAAKLPTLVKIPAAEVVPGDLWPGTGSRGVKITKVKAGPVWTYLWAADEQYFVEIRSDVAVHVARKVSA